MSIDAELIGRYLAEQPEAAAELERACLAARGQLRAPNSVRDVRSAFMFTDVADSTGLYDTYGDAYGRAIMQAHDRIGDAAIAAGGGSVVKRTGDGLLARFPQASAAVRAAMHIQHGVRHHRARYPLLTFRVSIGINVGPFIETDVELYGASLNLAARLCAAAPADAVYTTGIVAARCVAEGFEFSEMGSMYFKGFSAPIPVRRLRIAAEEF